MEKKLKVGEWDIKVYCKKHQIQGKKKVQKIKQYQDTGGVSTNILYSEDEMSILNKVETRLSRTKKDFETHHKLKKRPNIL